MISSRSAGSAVARSAEARSLSITASIPRRPAPSATGIPPPPQATTVMPLSTSARIDASSTISTGTGDGTTRRQPRPESCTTAQPRSRSSSRAWLLGVEGTDRLGRPREGGIVGVDADVCEDAGHRRIEGRLDERPDLRLGLGHGEPERKFRSLLRGPLLAQELVSDLRAVPVRDHDALAGAQHGRERACCLTQVRELLGGCSALARADERVTAERYDGGHPRVPGRPRSRPAEPASARPDAGSGTMLSRAVLIALSLPASHRCQRPRNPRATTGVVKRALRRRSDRVRRAVTRASARRSPPAGR